MKKPKMMSPRSYLWLAGFLILWGTMLITYTGIVQSYWRALNPLPSNWIVESDQYYQGVLSASNNSVDIHFEFFDSGSAIEFSEMYTNDTPITLTMHNEPHGLFMQLVNLTAPQDHGPHFVEILGGGDDATPVTVTIQRVTTDVRFELRIIQKHFIAYSLAPPPYLSFIIGYLLGGVLIATGFYLIEHTSRQLS